MEEVLKQEIPLGGGVWVENCEGQLFAATQRSLYKLGLRSWTRQVCCRFGHSSWWKGEKLQLEELLGESRVEEARELAKVALKTGAEAASAAEV